MVFSVTPPSPHVLSSSPLGAQRSTSLPIIKRSVSRGAGCQRVTPVVGFSVGEASSTGGSEAYSVKRHASLPPRARAIVSSALPAPAAGGATVTVGFEPPEAVVALHSQQHRPRAQGCRRTRARPKQCQGRCRGGTPSGRLGHVI